MASLQHDQLVEERKRLVPRKRDALESRLWELEQFLATEGLGPLELVGAGVVAGEAPDLGRRAQDAR